MRCYRKILHISYKDHVSNEEVRAKIQQAIGPHEDLLTIVKGRKLQCCGHVFRSSDLAKTTLQGTVKLGGGGGEDKADTGRGGKTTSGNWQAWSSPSPRGQWRTAKNGGNWLRNYLWCPSDPRGSGIDEMMMREFMTVNVICASSSCLDEKRPPFHHPHPHLFLHWKNNPGYRCDISCLALVVTSVSYNVLPGERILRPLT